MHTNLTILFKVNAGLSQMNLEVTHHMLTDWKQWLTAFILEYHVVLAVWVLLLTECQECNSEWLRIMQMQIIQQSLV